jgi:hypothetical protein
VRSVSISQSDPADHAGAVLGGNLLAITDVHDDAFYIDWLQVGKRKSESLLIRFERLNI